MNWKKRKLITAIAALATIGGLYAFVGPRDYHHHHHAHHGCHWQQEDSQDNTPNAEQPDVSSAAEVE